MKKIMISDKLVISMQEYSLNYCQLPESIVFLYCNYPHSKIKQVILSSNIARFPISDYKDEFGTLGFVLWVRDRSGQKLPYIKPSLLTNMSKDECIRRIIYEVDLQKLLEELLLQTSGEVKIMSLEPNYPETTHKKSYQKIIDRRRKEWL